MCLSCPWASALESGRWTLSSNLFCDPHVGDVGLASFIFGWLARLRQFTQTRAIRFDQFAVRPRLVLTLPSALARSVCCLKKHSSLNTWLMLLTKKLFSFFCKLARSILYLLHKHIGYYRRLHTIAVAAAGHEYFEAHTPFHAKPKSPNVSDRSLDVSCKESRAQHDRVACRLSHWSGPMWSEHVVTLCVTLTAAIFHIFALRWLQHFFPASFYWSPLCSGMLWGRYIPILGRCRW